MLAPMFPVISYFQTIYLLYKITGEKCIFIEQIMAKCINLSYAGSNMLTSVVNNVEDNV